VRGNGLAVVGILGGRGRGSVSEESAGEGECVVTFLRGYRVGEGRRD